MAIVLIGKDKGKEVEIIDYTQHWVKINNNIYAPSSLKYTQEEINWMKQQKEWNSLLKTYTLDNNLKLKRSKKYVYPRNYRKDLQRILSTDKQR